MRSSFHTVLFQWRALSTTVTSQPSYFSHHIQMRSSTFRQLIFMWCQGHFQFRPRQSRSRKRILRNKDSPRTSSIGQCTPSQFLPVTGRLWFRPIDHLVLYRALVLFNELSRFPIRIIIDRSTAIILVIAILLRYLHGKT